MSDPTKAILSGAEMLRAHLTWADPLAVLGAIAEIESDYGKNAVPRFEKNYAPEGCYYTIEQMARYRIWGAWACCSYGSFQIMYPTACELGFDREPWNRYPGDLNDDEVSVLFVVEFIKRRILDRGAQTVIQLADSYNSGTWKDANVPRRYIQRFDLAYSGVINKRGLRPV